MGRLIDADALAEVLVKHENDGRSLSEYEYGVNSGLEIAEMEIDDAPTVDIPTVDAKSVNHGHWIRTGRANVYGGIELICSECGDHVMVQHIEDELYCRHCGARLYGARYEE